MAVDDSAQGRGPSADGELVESGDRSTEPAFSFPPDFPPEELPVSDREVLLSRDDLDARHAAPSFEPADDDDRIRVLAMIAAATIAEETGAVPTPRLVVYLERGLRELLEAIDGSSKVKKTGPMPGKYSKLTAMERLRARNIPGDSGRRLSPLTEDLVAHGVTTDYQVAKWLALLLVGRDSLDGEFFMSSAVWASRLPRLTGIVGVRVMEVTRDAAEEWAVSVDRLRYGDASQSRRNVVKAKLAEYRGQIGRAVSALHEGGPDPAVDAGNPEPV